MDVLLAATVSYYVNQKGNSKKNRRSWSFCLYYERARSARKFFRVYTAKNVFCAARPGLARPVATLLKRLYLCNRASD